MYSNDLHKDGLMYRRCLKRKPEVHESHKQIEKRRRDRINQSLMELSQVIPAAFTKQSSRRLEKAEILEMTVQYIRAIENTEIATRFDKGDWYSSDIWADFLHLHQSGYSECMRELCEYYHTVLSHCGDDQHTGEEDALSRAHGGEDMLSRAAGAEDVLGRAQGGEDMLSRARGGEDALSREHGGEDLLSRMLSYLQSRYRPESAVSAALQRSVNTNHTKPLMDTHRSMMDNDRRAGPLMDHAQTPDEQKRPRMINALTRHLNESIACGALKRCANEASVTPSALTRHMNEPRTTSNATFRTVDVPQTGRYFTDNSSMWSISASKPEMPNYFRF